MKKKNLEAQKARLKKVSNKEWLDAMNELKRLIAWRLYGCKQYSGAHSEMALGCNLIRSTLLHTSEHVQSVWSAKFSQLDGVK